MNTTTNAANTIDSSEVNAINAELNRTKAARTAAAKQATIGALLLAGAAAAGFFIGKSRGMKAANAANAANATAMTDAAAQ